jgi:adenosylmethionine-8-amino-7-oxononanoate aminotransferase
MVLQLENTNRKIVAVGSASYHGPPSTSLGSKSPLWEKTHQVTYPVPIAGENVDESMYVSKFQNFLDEYEDEVGVLLIEPQWGSSQAAFPWPDTLLKTYVAMAKARGIRIVCDEIMCGLGRHGKGTLFVSEALDLDPDVITFGKAIGGGVFPFAGAILRNGRDALCSVGRTVMQSHTYAGASIRALMTATEVLKEIPVWLPSIQQNGQEMSYIFRYLGMISDGMLITHGQGLMWGAIFSKEGKMKEAGYRSLAVTCFHKHCEEVGILPYIVPCGGFMVTPVVDIDVGTIYEIGQKLEEAILRTMKEIKWKTQAGTISLQCNIALDKEPIYIGTCQDYLHATKSCTSCSKFVSPSARMRFVE